MNPRDPFGDTTPQKPIQPQPASQIPVQPPVMARAGLTTGRFEASAATTIPVRQSAVQQPRQVSVAQPVPVRVTPKVAAPQPVLTIPVYSSSPAPVAPKPIPVQPVQIRPQPSRPAALQPSAQPVQRTVVQQSPAQSRPIDWVPAVKPQPRVIEQQFVEEEPQPKRRGLKIFAFGFALLIVFAGAAFAGRILQKDPPQTEVATSKTQRPAVMGVNTTTTLDEAKTKFESLSTSLISAIKDGNNAEAYKLTSSAFQLATTPAEASKVFEGLKLSAQQSDLVLLSVACTKANNTETDKTLTSDSLCGGLYGFADPVPHQEHHYIVMVSDHTFSTMHTVRGFDVAKNTEDVMKNGLRGIVEAVQNTMMSE